jgi:4-hydroxybenzoate polyprenyltransferase
MASYATEAPISTPLTYLSLFGLGALVMRGAGCTINDMWDKNLDKAVGTFIPRVLGNFDANLGVQIELRLDLSLMVIYHPNKHSCFLVHSWQLVWASFSNWIGTGNQMTFRFLPSKLRSAHTNCFFMISILLGASSLSIVVIYPLMKRITYWPQAVLGECFPRWR